uniref:NADH-ubiquinone oxidoreductase chain 6 n=1 Tax=Pseudunio marocanus TaxID=518768 RepID=A0A1W5XF33_9BIVA|nr:NADH dehydrogenase subunit 6 [Pseudunio marocanus]ARH56119.1 NADH dehydrogenase subunit 6 [Pseudunio marocanus]
MTLLLLSTIWMYCTLNMIFPMHPLSLGLMVLLLAFISCTLIASASPWYAYMLFFIFIGGMLVMFAYIASLSPNTTFSINNQLIPLIFMLFTIYLSKDSTTISSAGENSELESSISLMAQSLSFLYSDRGATMLTLLACMLLFTMVIAVKLCKPTAGALRPYSTHYH